mmetsp:Transcript_9522/g.31096  ORF Transcript_9522/g.31096 Transcript_9522/m.31096 type:complete len:211 (+) Transcript_9522:82-714(+)
MYNRPQKQHAARRRNTRGYRRRARPAGQTEKGADQLASSAVAASRIACFASVSTLSGDAIFCCSSASSCARICSTSASRWAETLNLIQPSMASTTSLSAPGGPPRARPPRAAARAFVESDAPSELRAPPKSSSAHGLTGEQSRTYSWPVRTFSAKTRYCESNRVARALTDEGCRATGTGSGASCSRMWSLGAPAPPPLPPPLPARPLASG